MPDHDTSPRINTPFKRFFTKRFAQFCVVGASGVVVNLLALLVFRSLDVHASMASALAIQVSILSNFVVHEVWTFRDKREHRTPWARLARFQGVSLVGALIQWTIFLIATLVLHRISAGADALHAYIEIYGERWRDLVTALITEPPSIGRGIYFAQLVGIGVATGWNFLANFSWTWGQSEGNSKVD